jgi:glutamine cyclotransferase
VNLDQKHFGEGIALINNKIYQLTWTSGVGFEYDFTTFKQIRTFDFTTQGWGLTTNGKVLIMSDGSNFIRFMEPENFAELKRIEVYDNKGPIDSLNELEYINGEIFANIYQTDRIVIIDPETGMVKSVIDFKGLLKDTDRTRETDVLNGIAWDEAGKRLFVTGKLWPKLYQVELVSK